MMKIKSLILIVACCLSLIVACKHRSEPPTVPAAAAPDSAKNDSVAPDTAQSAEEVPISKKADEFFDDFAFAFMKKPRFQRSRIVFPLEHIVDGRRSEIAGRAWKHDRMYSKRETYTLIFDSAKGEKMAKDTSVKHVTVEELDLLGHRVKSYVFSKSDGEWRLVRLEDEQMEHSANSDFYAFYQQFATDDEFRRAHMVPRLAFSTYDEDNFKRMEGFISPDQWSDFAPELPKGKLTNILYGQSFANTNLRLLAISTPSSGFTSTLTFRRKKGKWMLTRLEN